MIVYRHGLLNYEHLSESPFYLVKLDKMIQSEPYVFITDQEDIKLSQIKPSSDEVTGITEEGKTRKVKKRTILVACPAKAWTEVKTKMGVAPQLKQVQKSILLKDWILKSALDKQFGVRVIIRCGDILSGKIKNYDEIAIYLQIGEHVLGIYRHSLYSLSTTEVHTNTVKEFDPEKGYGFINFGKNRKINQKGIYVRSSSVKDKDAQLKVNEKVTFNVRYTAARGLQAINVKRVKSRR